MGKGEKVSRPDYTEQTQVTGKEDVDDGDEEQEEEVLPGKKNFEETSEDEE